MDRHRPVLRALDPEAPLSVGNGELAFTADVTGLQTFAEAYDATIPLGTLSQWGWHTRAEPAGLEHRPLRLHGVRRARPDGRLRGHPRRPPHARGRVAAGEPAPAPPRAYRLPPHAPGRPAPRPRRTSTDVEQVLDLWNGVLRSRFRLDGEPVEVETLCHPRLDLVAVRVVSPLLAAGADRDPPALPLRQRRDDRGGLDAARGARDDARAGRRRASAALARRLDADRYHVRLGVGARRPARRGGAARLRPRAGARAGTRSRRSWPSRPRRPAEPLPGFEEARRAAREHWNRFWSTGGAIDLSGSRDPRWRELERRIVLSQYLTAIQCAGRTPPQETGLTFNSWHGKFHLEMHWWHAVALRPLGPAPAAGAEPRLLRRHPPARPGDRAPAGLRRRALAEDDRPERRGVAVERRPVPRLAAAASDLLRRARATASAATARRSSGSATSSSRRRSSWRPSPRGTRPARRYVLGPPLQGAQEIFPKDRTFNTRLRARLLALGPRGRPAVARAAGAAARAPVAARSSTGSRRCPSATAGTSSPRPRPRASPNPRWARDHPSVTGALGDAAGTRGRPRDDGADLRLDLAELELAGHVGLGLPDAGDVRGAPGPAGARGRRAAPRRAEERATARTATTTSGRA